jgi:hypothetical protein
MHPVDLGQTFRYKTIHDLHLRWDALDTGRWYTDVLVEYASKPEVQTVTEFGTYQGMSAVAFLTTDIKELHSIDINFDRMYQGEKELINRLKSEDATWTLHQQSSHDPISWNSDLIFIDTVHQRDHVAKELRAHHEKANKYIVIHDTNYPKGSPPDDPNTVGMAVREFLAGLGSKDWAEVYHDKSHTGMMILERKSR